MKELMTLAAVLVCSVSLTDAYPLDNGLARTPPMGWNSWNTFGCDVNEQLIREMADAIVTSGMKDAGYVYLVINDRRSIATRREISCRTRNGEVWAKQLADGGRAVVLFNRGPKSQEISVSWTDIGYPQHVAAQV